MARTITRILVVDDDKDIAEATATLLDVLGYDARQAHSGAAALDTLEVFDADIVLLDINLGDTTGFDVARQIRADAHADAYLVAVTGNERPNLPAEAFSAGFDQFRLKPLTLVTIREVLHAAAATER